MRISLHRHGSLIFSSTQQCTRSLQSSLARTIQWPSLSTRSFTIQMMAQLRSRKLPQQSPPSFWKATSKSLSRTLQTTLDNVEKLIEQQEAEAFFEGAWQEEVPAVASSSDEASGRIDGTLPSLQSAEGNVPLHLKLKLAHALGSFTP